MPDVHIYAGPTATREDLELACPGAVLHPPVSHGDLLGAGLSVQDKVLIVDGVFLHAAPVRHKEIVEIMARGVVVAGASSMGALRASELDRCGMVGLGDVYGLYRDGVIESDDEVAVVHLADGDRGQVSEALVNIRLGVRAAAWAGVLTEGDAERIVELARSIQFPQRSWPNLHSLARSTQPGIVDALAAVRAYLERNPEQANTKRVDALRAAALMAQVQAPAEAGELTRTAAAWRTCHLEDWLEQGEHGASADGLPGRLARVRYRQIYDPGFADVWRGRALERLGHRVIGAPADDWVVSGVDREALEFWATAREIRTFEEGELSDRVVVRSLRSRSNALRPLGLLTDEIDSFVSEDPVFLGRLAHDWNIGRTLADHGSQVRESTVRRHLADVWAVSATDEPHLSACARDRGFVDVDEAVRSARPFVLGYLLRNGVGTLTSKPTSGES